MSEYDQIMMKFSELLIKLLFMQRTALAKWKQASSDDYKRDTNQEMKTWLSDNKVLTCLVNVQSSVLRKEKEDTNNSIWCNSTVQGNNSILYSY